MYIFNVIDQYSYKLSKCQINTFKSKKHIIASKYITECSNNDCIYNRNKTKLRQKFQNKIIKFANNKKNIKILFFGSFLLLQELIITRLLNKKVTEVHFVDYAYKNFLKDNIFIATFTEFIDWTIKYDLDIKIYIHTNPEHLIISTFCKKRFDIISGIDFYSETVYDDNCIKKIAINTLNETGMMFLSQNRLNLIDILCYQIRHKHIELVKAVDYLKTEYYYSYKSQYLLAQLLRPYNFFIIVIPFLIYYPKISSLFLLVYIYYYCFIGRKQYKHKYKILNYKILLKSKQ